MSHVQYVDDLVKEYLLFRGFSQSLRAFDADVKAEKEKGFRVDKVIDQLMQYIHNYDLCSLREYWGLLDTKLFTHLEYNFFPGVKKLEHAILKIYVVNTIINNKTDKIQEFFLKMTSELHSLSEWKEWFTLPFIKNPEENPIFSIYFNRQWQETILISLHNFLATIFQCISMPTLLMITEGSYKFKRLQEENERLKYRLNELVKINSVLDLNVGQTFHPKPLMDDFYIIAQESPLIENSKILRTLIKNIGCASSPILGRKSYSNIKNFTDADVTSKRGITKGSLTSIKKSDFVCKRSTSCDSRLTRQRDSSVDFGKSRNNDKFDGSYILLSQEEYREHKSSIIQCKSNASGSYVATGDSDGVIKIWTPIPSPKTVNTFISSNSNKAITALDWISKNERYFIHGDNNGSIQLHDTRDCKTIWEIQHEGYQIVSLVCNPIDSTFVTSLSDCGKGKLLLYNLKMKKIERILPLEKNINAICSSFNHNGQLLVTGLSNGNVIIHDLRKNEIIDNLNFFSRPVVDIELTNDFTNICALSKDGILCQRSLSQTEKIIWETKIQIEKNSVHGKLFTFDQSGSHMLLCTQTGGSIYKMPPNPQAKILELMGHEGTLCCEWSTANQCGTCITGGAEGHARVSTLLSP